jgi:hypothetical protein
MIMEKEITKKMKKFNNITDDAKVEFLELLGEEKKDSKIDDFLIKIIESDTYYKIRIKAVLTLAKFEDDEVAQKLSEIYAYERDRNVRLAITESLGDMTTNTEEMLQNILKNDLNDIVRAAALRKLHERKKLKKDALRKLMLSTIKKEKDTFPKQIALSLLPSYATQTVYKELITIYDDEVKFKMRSLIYKTITEVADALKIEVDVDEPERPKPPPELKKRRQRRKQKKKQDKEPEEHLFF